MNSDKPIYREVREWVYRNARPLDFARWRYHFEDGSAEDVLRALAAYQNPDGGFGHGLDADNWNPNSTPYNAGCAIRVFDELNLCDPKHPMIAKMLAYLDETPYFNELGWPFSIPSNNDYPHAVWWGYSEENNLDNRFHATGPLVGFILRAGDRESRLYQKALNIADRMLADLRASVKLDGHDAGAYCALLNGITRAGLYERFDVTDLTARLTDFVNASIERDPEKWGAYSMMPSQYIKSPDSPFYAGNEEIVKKEMTYRRTTRLPDGVWDITWQWHTDQYPSEFIVTRQLWRGSVAVDTMLMLRAFGSQI